MKKILTLLIFSLVALMSYSQTVYISKNYKTFFSAYQYHRNPICKMIRYHSYMIGINELEAKEYGHTVCDVCANFVNTTDTVSFVFVSPEKMPGDQNINLAGQYLKNSAICSYASIGTSVITSIIILSEDDNDTRLATGCIGGAITLGLSIASIQYKFKAGKMLSISSNKIQYNF